MSLGFDLLDRHVVDGRGDDIACTDDSGTLSFAQLLERSAALAGGLRALGVGAGDEVAVLVGPGNVRVQIVCACIRLGAVPSARGNIRIVESSDVVSVQTAEEKLELPLVVKIGKTDPAPSLPSDEPGYRDRVREEFGDVIDLLV